MVTITAPSEIRVNEGGLEILASAEESQELDARIRAVLGQAVHEPIREAGFIGCHLPACVATSTTATMYARNRVVPEDWSGLPMVGRPNSDEGYRVFRDYPKEASPCSG